MMDDRLDFDILKNELESIQFTNITFSKRSFSCETKTIDTLVNFECVLPETFPYDFPVVYISKEIYDAFQPLPHINSDLSICTFDKATAVPNFNAPLQLILATLSQARKIIQQGISKENTADFQEEFSSYWSTECTAKAESIFDFSNKPTTLSAYYASQTGKVYLANTKGALNQYLNNIGITKRYLKDYHDCLYLPLSIDIYPPFPNTNIDMYKAISRDKTVSSIYETFLRKRLPGSAFVAFSTTHSNQRCLQLFAHTNVSYSTNGFRKGHIPIELAYLRDTKKNAPIKFLVEDMRQKRLFSRGGVGLMDDIKKIAIIGCGSVGSYITEALCECGISSFVLIDNDSLSAENIARHFCGYEYIGKKKVSAIKDKLCKHNPNILSEAYDENGLLFLQNHLEQLNSCDLIFVATANLPLEHKIVTEICAGAIEKPVVFTWVEPFLSAGHAILINKSQNIFSDLFNEEYIFSDRVVLNGEFFQKRESGCQSTYSPYGAFELKRFIYELLSYLFHENLPKKKSGNYLFSWIGNLHSVEKHGGKISSKWSTATPYSKFIKRID